MPEALLEMSSLSAGYGKLEVLHGLSLRVNQGEVVSILGANGAGKSTLLRSISRLIPSRAETLTFSGESLLSLPAHAIVAKGLAHVPEGRQVFPRMSVYENLLLGGYALRETDTEREELIFSLFPVLKERRQQPAGTLSGGEQQMLAIGRALMSKPRMLILDEPSMGIAPLLVVKIFESLQALNKAGLTLLLVEQNAHLALKISGRAYVLENGSITIEGSAAELGDDPRVRAAYLGC